MPVRTERHRDPELSYFKARRIDAATDCAEIVAEATTWFEASDP